MDTSGAGAAGVVLIWAVVGLAGAAAASLPVRTRRPAVALGLCVAVALPSVVGLLVPAVYAAALRDPAAVADGQWWRLATAVVVQDGGWVGLAGNLALLAVAGTVAGRVRGPGWVVAVFVTCGIAFNLVAVGWGRAGAGNSAATLALAAAVVAGALARRRDLRTAAVAAATAGAAAALLALGDGHGVAVLLGLLAGAAGAAAALVGRSPARIAPGGGGARAGDR